MFSLRGLGELTWLEIKIFLREPMGAIGSIVIPVVAFLLLGRFRANSPSVEPPASMAGLFSDGGVPVLLSILISINAVLSLVTIISIYREGGILKRLRATPLRPPTILTAHVLVKLLLTAITMTLMVLAGRRYFTVGHDVPLVSFGVALLLSTWSVLSVGFIIASMVPTARFAQPIGALVMYPMIGLSGLFIPIEKLPPGLRALTHVLPLTYSVSLMEGIWRGDSWWSHATDVFGLLAVFAVCTAISSKVFRWE